MARPVRFATDVEVRISQSAIARLTAPAGPVWSWCERRLLPTARRNAKAFAPVRTGRLQRSIRAEMVKTNQSSCTVFMAAGRKNAHYADYVHGGTRPQEGLFLLYANDRQVGGSRLPDAIAGGHAQHYKIWKYQVAGQSPQPFLVEGIDVALAQLGVRA